MPSSISSSEALLERPPRAPAPTLGLRLTAADRPGVAQPVPERDIPNQPWRAISLAVLVIVAALTGAWEWKMRTLGLRAGDFDDGPSLWAEQRRRVDAEAAPVVIVGDSRILFDTNLDRFQALTGVRPVQLALQGTNGRPFLENLADDPKFKGLVLVGMAELSYFRTKSGLMQKALDRAHFESPAQRGSFLVRRFLERHLAFMDNDYRLSTLGARLDPDLRPGADDNPYDDVWKIGETFDGRQTILWSRIETDPRLRDHARHAWNGFRGKPITPEVIAMTRARTKAAVDKIRARGGEVVFVRPPSALVLRVNEEQRLPRAKGWDELLKATRAQGVHADDLPQAQKLLIPEFSHLDPGCAVVFTDAYVRRLTQLTSRLKLLANAPAPLSTADCAPGAGRLKPPEPTP
jgi:hypothetical protein